MQIPRSVRIFLLLALLAAAGCPTVAVVDPGTETLLANGTAASIEVELVLDPAKYNLEPSQDPLTFAQDWLEAFTAGEGVTALKLDVDRLRGRYSIAPSGYMVVHHSMGTERYHFFKSMRLVHGDESVTFTGDAQISPRFRETDIQYRYELRVTDQLFREGG